MSNLAAMTLPSLPHQTRASVAYAAFAREQCRNAQRGMIIT